MTDPATTTARPPAPRTRTDVAGQPPVLHGDVLAPPTADTGVPGISPARLDVARWLARHQLRPGADVAWLRELADDVSAYAEASRSQATRRKYDAGWRVFADWCAEYGLPPGPPTPVEVVALYLAQMARDHLAMSTLDGSLAAIRDRHLDAGLLPPTDDPRLRRTRKGVRRLRGRPGEGVPAVNLRLLAAMLATLPTDAPEATAALPARRAHLAALRDRCLLTVGFFAALRREELAGLPVDHLELRPEGLRLIIARSKADQEGRGRRIDLPEAPAQVAWLCPVRAILAWLDATGRRPHLYRAGRIRTGAVPLLSGITSGARVRVSALTDRHVARVVKATATESGQRPEIVEALAGHSLRAGFATTAEAAGVPRPVVDRVLGHSTGTGGRYIRHAFDGTAQQAVYGLAAQLE